MKLLELPLDVFRIVITFTVREIGLKKSMKARLTCRTFAEEILDAVITTRTIEEVSEGFESLFKINYHHDVIARYLHHRLRTDGPATHPWITTLRQTSRMLAQHAGAEDDPARVELLERSACSCLAVNAGSSVFDVLSGEEPDKRTHLEGGTWANCLALAAWVGDDDDDDDDAALVESLSSRAPSDPPSFFGRPSWAAAARGHGDILAFLLNRCGALPYDPAFEEGPAFDLAKSPLAAAAYMGHEAVIRLYLQQSQQNHHHHHHHHSQTRLELPTAISYAAQGDRPAVLRLLLDHYRAGSAPQEFAYAVDGALVGSCRRGAVGAARTLLLEDGYDADADATDAAPRSCLQLAAIAGSAPLVRMLLGAGAALEAPDRIRDRSAAGKVRRRQVRRRQRDALTEAYRRDHVEIIRLIEERQVEILKSS